MNSLKQDLVIDEFNLVEEWLNQAELFNSYAEEKTEADKKLGKAKEELEVISAELKQDIARTPKDYGIIVKPTVQLIDAVVIQDKDYVRQRGLIIDLIYERDMCSNAVKAIDIKKSALENIVKLHGQNYFATPSEKGIKGEVIGDMKEGATKGSVSRRMRRNKK